MKEELLNESAETYWQESEHGLLCKTNCIECFKSGARWHESLPLADRLSESEKERIREIYNNLDYEDKGSWSMKEIAEYAMQNQRKRKILESIFGKNLFNPTEQ